ncbi:MAG: TlpA family protein disulfide reductase, partial [Alteromonadaceae bacterium]|nr:TlpA family protein disulfide reductase [Alteromonadaceae bacterium]
MLSLTLGPLAISVGQALIVLAFLVALVAGKLSARRSDVAIGDAIINLALVGFVVARLVFVGRYFASYGWSPLAWIDIRDGGFDMITGLLAIGVYGGFLSWRPTALRPPLFIAAFAGLLTRGLTDRALSLFENRANPPPEATRCPFNNEALDPAHLQPTLGTRPTVVHS